MQCLAKCDIIQQEKVNFKITSLIIHCPSNYFHSVKFFALTYFVLLKSANFFANPHQYNSKHNVGLLKI